MCLTGCPVWLDHNKEYDRFKSEGGDIVFTIDGTDISEKKEFEQFPSVIPKLQTGFELPPTTMIHAAELLAQIRVRGSEWDNILASVYLCGGKIIYKQIGGGKYEAHCSVPKQV
jgi:hypothetical protein